ncbi:sugar transferase [Rhizobium bangladeshense]|uniref:sugar transferase n=1 Tax=Rhizobium bangladeshense TaxID=1138189 RepID=UPI0007E57F91|nr:sugar transferase [Rhizobium bangladeshense]
MDSFLIAVIAIVAGIIGSAFAKILADEFKAWRPNMVHRLIGIAASLLSDVDRDRYHEEWNAHVEEIPGDLGKLLSGVGFIWAAFRMSDRRFLTLGTKRAMDMTMALAGLVFLSPPILIVALAIKIESPGPIFFAHRRIGKDGKEFGLLKFRAVNLPSEGQPARLTKVGRFMRLTNVDELPQLINILRGEMSVVGPRALPHDPQANKENIQMLEFRQRMRPGLTGMGQLLRPTGDSRSQAVVVSDLLYVMKHSISLDVGILMKTAMRVFSDRETSLAAGVLAFIAFSVPLAIMIAFLIAA